MQTLANRIAAQRVGAGELAVYWLGQAGFVFKSAQGALIAVDPYFSDCCERYFGFRRLMPHMMESDDLEFDLVVATHAHYDHFDVDAMPRMLSGGRTQLACARDCRAECERLNLPPDRITYLSVGDEATFGDMRVHAVACDHGELAPDALGVVLYISGKRIYITGDTCLRPDLFSDPVLGAPDLLILPINGAFGNLNERQAAQAAALIRPRLALPCHYWNFARHGGDPGEFERQMAELAPDIAYALLPMGGCVLI